MQVKIKCGDNQQSNCYRNHKTEEPFMDKNSKRLIENEVDD